MRANVGIGPYNGQSKEPGIATPVCALVRNDSSFLHDCAPVRKDICFLTHPSVGADAHIGPFAQCSIMLP